MSDGWGKGRGGAGDLEGLLSALTGGRGAAGIEDLLGQLRTGGLGQQVDSWIGTGANDPVEPDQIGQALGPAQLEALGSRSGLGGGMLAMILAQVLPMLIDRMSPQGRMPRSEGEMGGGGLGDILGGILGGGGLGSVLGGMLGGGAPGRGQEVEPPPDAAPRGKPRSAAWPDDEASPGAVHPGKRGYPGKPGYEGSAGGKPGWPADPPRGGTTPPDPDSGSALDDLARSVDRLRRR